MNVCAFRQIAALRGIAPIIPAAAVNFANVGSNLCIPR
jgi:hypothetical protein